MTQFNKAECMRRLKVVGKEFVFTFYDESDREYKPQPRKVAHVQTNAVAFDRHNTDDTFKLAQKNPHANASWLYFDSKYNKYEPLENGGVAVYCTYHTAEPVLKMKYDVK